VETLNFQLLNAKEVVDFEHYGEAKIFEYIYFHKDYPTMTANRFDLGVQLLRQGFTLQEKLNKQILIKDSMKKHIQ